MPQDQLLILFILAATIVMFVWGRWRHDMVALGSLLACVLSGLLPSAEAFVGFGHPAVITVACVLVLSRTLQTSGAIDVLVQHVLPSSAGPTLTIGALTGLGAMLSAFMNNVGALALLMPVAIRIAKKQKLPPGKVLMPLAFGTILGGMTTLIGTPPNLIVSSFRAKTETGSFTMFDFTPVGLAVAMGGVLFVVLIGWRLVPSREKAGVPRFDIGVYLTEARVTEKSKAHGKTVLEIEQSLDETDAQVLGIIRNKIRVGAPKPSQILQVGDVLVIEAEPESLASVLTSLGLNLKEDIHTQPKAQDNDKSQADKVSDGEKKNSFDELALIELVVRPDAALIGSSATDIHLRTRHGINFLAFSRQGQHSVQRLRSVLFRTGDVLLMQGEPEAVLGFASEFGCVPLEQRPIRIPNKRQAITATIVMVAAICGAAFGLLPAAISFAAGVLTATALRVIPLRTVYEAIDWPVIVLLAALFPVASVLASTGAADQVARLLLENLAQGHAVIGLTTILVFTMVLSSFINNAATAAMMCPIALSTATQLAVKSDPFLMAVAIGASCAFLTPIGHQNNTLIMGPAGLRFSDYWRLGLPLEILVVIISVPMLLLIWPL
ncbi:MAG: SLC13 family permease [Akkermansiaceae bacterium]|jgi:di/tricarboxylate transporter